MEMKMDTKVKMMSSIARPLCCLLPSQPCSLARLPYTSHPHLHMQRPRPLHHLLLQQQPPKFPICLPSSKRPSKGHIWSSPCASASAGVPVDPPGSAHQLGNPQAQPSSDSAERAGLVSSPEENGKAKGFWRQLQINTAELRAQVAKLGLAAVLAYGLFDGITYTTFFVLAFLGYEKSTGKNPAANVQALIGVVLLMWTGNNVTRPLRVAGAAALAPIIDRALKNIQEILKLPNQLFAFLLAVATFASVCLSIVGLLILSRWAK